ncbi:MAG: hemolysin III family protein [Clostridia bacterium]
MNKAISIKNMFKAPQNVDEIKDMYTLHNLIYYYPIEEFFNVLTHALGVVVGLVLLIFMTLAAKTPVEYVTAVFSSIAIMVMYGCSTAYHAVTNIRTKSFLRRIDYASINLTVIACGTGACLLHGNVSGYAIYGVAIALSLVVMLLCVFFFGKFRYFAVVSNFINGALLSAAYIIAAPSIPLVATGFYIAGLLLVLIGACLFGVKTKFIHSVFHVFVLVGPMLCMLSNLYQII